MKKILCITENRNDSVSYYRSVGVFKNLKKYINIDITVLNTNELRESWATLLPYDIVFMQRPNTLTFLTISKYIKNLHIPLWVDWDDNLFVITDDNPGYDYYNDNIKKLCAEIIESADIVTVSTLELKRQFLPLNKNIEVVPNAFNSDLLSMDDNFPTSKTVLWRGSETHVLDLLMVSQSITNVMLQNPDYTFLFYGYNPFFIPGLNKKNIAVTDIMIYLNQLKKLAPEIVQVPLADTLFNLCKSNIAFIEGSYAGAVCLVPEWEEWILPGVVTYVNMNDYMEKLQSVIDNKQGNKTAIKEARQYIMEYLCIDITNLQRVEIIKNL